MNGKVRSSLTNFILTPINYRFFPKQSVIADYAESQPRDPLKWKKSGNQQASKKKAPNDGNRYLERRGYCA
jgi:hypothetical protein